MISQYYRVYATTKATAIETSNKKSSGVNQSKTTTPQVHHTFLYICSPTLYKERIHKTRLVVEDVYWIRREFLAQIAEKKNVLGSFLSYFRSFKRRAFHAHLNGTVGVLFEKRFS